MDTDTGEALPGWTIKLYKWNEALGDDGDWEWIDNTLTAQDDGKYCFKNLPAGDYRVSETLKQGWTQTSPDSDEGYVHLITLPTEEEMEYDFCNMPKMKCYDDTIWAYGGEDGTYTDGLDAMVVPNNTVEGNPSNNWGWTNQITCPGIYVFTLYRGAGQNNLDNGTPVGTLTVNYNSTQAAITYEVVEPYTLREAHLWVGDDMLPLVAQTKKGETTLTPTAAPGQLAKLGFNPEISEDGLSASIIIDITAPFWVAAHGVVDWCEMVALPETTYYHWGVGYPYGATPETYATASVSPEGIMDVWWYSDSVWYHDIYHSAEPLTWDVALLNAPVKMLHELYYQGVTEAHCSRTQVDITEVPAPNAMSILIP
ncbi:MAG: hypothetical protein XD91_0272 [Clostridiales bacterium 38_11]|nr:MAG: hypothetical protein XD91_0272 [Clostridiales bacterium 38_11]HBH13226.1 hypothetical protein [Clostridiales bacterium]